MTEKKSIKATLSGLGASSLSILGICCGSGACAASCGVACVAPVVSTLGISTAVLTTWSSTLLPVFTAISAVAFTIAYYSIYKPTDSACCDDPSKTVVANPTSPWTKSGFWIGLLLTLGFYTKAMSNQAGGSLIGTTCNTSTSSCSPATISASGAKSCKPADCVAKLIQDEDN